MASLLISDKSMLNDNYIQQCTIIPMHDYECTIFLPAICVLNLKTLILLVWCCSGICNIKNKIKHYLYFNSWLLEFVSDILVIYLILTYIVCNKLV